MSEKPILVTVVARDALEVRADALVVKHAQGSFGVDKAVLAAFRAAGSNLEHKLPKPGKTLIEDSHGALGADQVSFVGTPFLYDLEYSDLRRFGFQALTSLRDAKLSAQTVVLTLHGVAIGLDESEAFEAILAGLIEAVRQGKAPTKLREISFAERDPRRAERLLGLLGTLLPGGKIYRRKSEDDAELDAGARGTTSKPHVFVAMPFQDEMDDVFYYGIQSPVNDAGFLCERADLASFTGDIVDWVRTRISNSSLIIAEVSTPNPNVYLEIGFAWGVDRPVLLLSRDPATLHFDIRGQKCIQYTQIRDLELKLRDHLTAFSND